jgi:hypothetical protein
MTVLKQTVVVSTVACLPDDAERTPKKRKKEKIENEKSLQLTESLILQ